MSVLDQLNNVPGASQVRDIADYAVNNIGFVRNLFGESKLERRNRKARKRMRRRAIKEQNALGYAGMFKNQANAARQAMQQEQPVGAVNAIQNSVTNAVDAQPVVQQPSAYDPLTQFNPADLDPTMGAALTPPSNAMANLQDPATRSFGIAGLGANAMFGGPLARQRSMSNKYIKK